MRKSLKNDLLEIEVETLGAELVRLSSSGDDYNYMWTGDAKYWSGQSPILFPIVQSLKKTTSYKNGQVHKLGNHGFARKSEFECVSESEDALTFELVWNQETIEQYPYKFKLQMTYRLVGNKVTIDYRVTNVDDKAIYFQLGTHPGLQCPIRGKGEFSDYKVIFDQAQTAKRYFCDADNCVITDKEAEGLVDTDEMKLSHEIFYEGAHIFKDVHSASFTLTSKASPEKIRVSQKHLPYFGIWQPKDAPFVCLEPWYGVGDLDNWEGLFEEKDHMIELLPKGVEAFQLGIEIIKE